MIEKQALHHYTSFQSCAKKLPFPFLIYMLVHCVLCFSLALFNHDYFINGCRKWCCHNMSFCVFVILLQNLLHILDLLPFSNFQPNFIVVTNWYIVCIYMYLHRLCLQPNTSLFCKKLDHWVKLRLIMWFPIFLIMEYDNECWMHNFRMQK